jgi:membrane fusion protein, heavy metal efflux system
MPSPSIKGRKWPWARPSRRVALGLLGIVLLIGAAAAYSARPTRGGGPAATSGPSGGKAEAAAPGRPSAVRAAGGEVELSLAQQEAIGLETARVVTGETRNTLRAPGRVAPDEAHYAYITPRASGVVRSVAAHIGQDVKAGDLLATIDSPEVAQARLDLVTRVQELEIAGTRADWQGAIYKTTTELIERLKAGDSPDKIHERFEGRPLGENRERLMTAYAQYRLTKAARERNEQLLGSRAVSMAKYQESVAEFEAAQATYQALMDRMGFEAKLAHSLAQQELHQAETSVQVARERLRVLGVKPDGTEPKVEAGRVVGVRPDGTLPKTSKESPAEATKPEAILHPEGDGSKDEVAVAPVGAQPEAPEAKKEGARPISAFSIWAPFDGTILDRAMIVPGVAVEKGQQLYTLANLATVWVEAHINESDFDELARSRDAEVRLTSPAYPGRAFRGRVIYSGDTVDEKTRSVLLLARADNPDRALKPGMYVEVEVYSPSPRRAPLVPRAALLTDGDRQFVFVRKGPARFERREVELGAGDASRVAVLRGLREGDEVVVRGGFKLKAEAHRLAEAEAQ